MALGGRGGGVIGKSGEEGVGVVAGVVVVDVGGEGGVWCTGEGWLGSELVGGEEMKIGEG